MKNLHLFVMILLSIFLFSNCEKSEDILVNEKWDFAYKENYVDSLNAIFSSEGYIALFGGTNFHQNSKQEKLERTIYVTKADLDKGIIDEEDATLIILDSTYMPIQISSQKCIIRFSEFKNGNFSCLVSYDNETEWIEYEGLKLESLGSLSETSTRSLSTGGVSDFTIANVLKALDIVNGLKGCFESASMKECVSQGVGVFSNFIPNSEIGITGGLISAELTKSVNSGLLSILSYAGEKIANGPLKYLGPVKLSIENVEQIDAHSCKIGYMVDGLHEYGMKNSDLYFVLRNVKTGKYYPRLYLDSKNCYEKAVIANLTPGEYGIVLKIRTKKYNWEYTTYPEIKFSILNLEMDRYKINEEPLYENGAVNFKLQIFLKGNEEELKDVKQFGYYIKYANKIDYKQVNNLSSIFESTPLTYELLIPRDDFMNESTNFTTFVAKPSADYFIGAYVVLKNGKIIHFDEERIEGIEYCKKPEIQFIRANVGKTKVIETYDNGDVSYETDYKFDLDVSGCFWIDYIQFTISDKDVHNYWDAQYPRNDRTYSYSGVAAYTNSKEYVSYYTIHLTNGKTMLSQNALLQSLRGFSSSFSVIRYNPQVHSNKLSYKNLNIGTSINARKLED